MTNRTPQLKVRTTGKTAIAFISLIAALGAMSMNDLVSNMVNIDIQNIWWSLGIYAG